MLEISRGEAIHTLSNELPKLPEDDLVEVYNELFPEHPTNEESVHNNKKSIMRKIDEHVRRGLEVEEIVDLWNVVFPRARHVWFDENADVLLYSNDIPSNDQ